MVPTPLIGSQVSVDEMLRERNILHERPVEFVAYDDGGQGSQRRSGPFLSFTGISTS
jgi:hypothetical protein